MKNLIILLIFSLPYFCSLSQEINSYYINPECITKRPSAKNLLIEFKHLQEEEEIDAYIKALNLKLFCYKNDVLIIDREIFYTFNRIDFIILDLSKMTTPEGVKDLMKTLQNDTAILYKSYFYKTKKGPDHRVALRNIISAEFCFRSSRDSLNLLAENYKFDYKLKMFRTAADISLTELSELNSLGLYKILYNKDFFKNVKIECIALGKMKVDFRNNYNNGGRLKF